MLGLRRSRAIYASDDLRAYLAEHFKGATAPIACALSEVPDGSYSTPNFEPFDTLLERVPVPGAAQYDESNVNDACTAGVPASFGAPASLCAPCLDDLLNDLDEGFSPTLLHLIDERGLTDVQAYRRANVSRQLFSKIRKDPDYRPTKQTALAFAVALGLTLEEARDLLARAGFALSHSSRFDVIVEYFLVKGPCDVMVVNQALYDYGEPLLGSA